MMLIAVSNQCYADNVTANLFANVKEDLKGEWLVLERQRASSVCSQVFKPFNSIAVLKLCPANI